MPDTAHLYRILSVSPTPGDALQLADLASPKAYRQALQRALINRRPALYSRGWLCTRLGISVWTCRRYDRQIGFQVRPAFFESWLDEKKALELPEESDEKNGVFLERSDGKRFPALRGIALDLIRRRWGVRLKRQHWNYYRYGPGRPILAPAHERPQPKIMVEPPVTPHPPAEKEQVFHPADESPAPAEQSRGHIWVCQECLKIRMTDTPAPPEPCPVCKQARWDSVPHSIWFDQQAVMAWWQALCRARNERMKPQPAPAAPPPSLTPRQAALAERLYSTIYDLKPERALARGMCYDLVIQYDEKLVTWILGELKERRNIYNPAGFVITVLRSEHKYGNFTLKR